MAAQGQPDVDTPNSPKPELLIVDDDPLITDTLDFVLGKDYSVRVADSIASCAAS